MTTLAGKALVSGSSDGTGTLATFLYPLGIALDAGGTFALVVSVSVWLRDFTCKCDALVGSSVLLRHPYFFF